jgi:DMSO/TMAO reductase YedYZ heme-binding membrane subunit
MAKVMGTMMTIWGFVLGIVTFLNYINSPSHIEYNNTIKYSLIDSGIMIPAVIAFLLLLAGITFLMVSKEPRED